MQNENLSEWVKKYTSELLNWAYHKTSSMEIAEDLVQETFLAAAEKFQTFKHDSSPKTWLFSILNHKIIDYYRKKVKQPIGFDENKQSGFFDSEGSWKPEKQPKSWSEAESHLLDEEGFQKVLKKCLDALPDKWRAGVQMKYLTEKSSKEICQDLEITSSNYWQMLHRAKLQLRDCIEKNWFLN